MANRTAPYLITLITLIANLFQIIIIINTITITELLSEWVNVSSGTGSPKLSRTKSTEP